MGLEFYCDRKGHERMQNLKEIVVAVKAAAEARFYSALKSVKFVNLVMKMGDKKKGRLKQLSFGIHIDFQTGSGSRP